jgi:hypothetical protein
MVTTEAFETAFWKLSSSGHVELRKEQHKAENAGSLLP